MQQGFTRFFALCWAVFAVLQLQAQVGINILNPDSSAILHLESRERGFLPPRMTTAERDNIANPHEGLLIFNEQDSMMQYYNGECWINTWQRNCRDCALDFDIARGTGNIDRIVTNEDSVQLFVRQTAGSPRTIAVYVIPNLPQGMTATLNRFTVNGSDTLTLTVHADIFTRPGTYPIIVQAVCGNSIGNQVFVVTVEPCIEIDINSPRVNYNLQVANNLPTNVPICVVARVAPGVTMTNTGTNPVFNTGGLHPASRVGILNGGDLLALGGNGGVGTGTGGGGAGEPGTDAVSLSVNTHIINNGRIYGGGGGGGAVAFAATLPIPGISFTLGIGAGGGGGARDGQGGALGAGLGYYAPGTNATSGVNAQPGQGGVLTTPISFSITVVNITLTPNVFGGNGGGYGLDGTSGTLQVNVRAQISVPFVGTVTIFNQNFPDPPPTNFPPGGPAGFAVKRNGNTLIGLGDGNYQSNNLKGPIGN